MSLEAQSAKSYPLANHNWTLMRQVVELLRKSSVGLTPSTLLELIEEQGNPEGDEVSRRGTYQRILRAVQQLEAMGIVVRSGRRYILQPEALRQELQRQAQQAVQRVFDMPFLTREPGEIQEVVLQALQGALGQGAGSSPV